MILIETNNTNKTVSTAITSRYKIFEYIKTDIV